MCLAALQPKQLGVKILEVAVCLQDVICKMISVKTVVTVW